MQQRGFYTIQICIAMYIIMLVIIGNMQLATQLAQRLQNLERKIATKAEYIADAS